MFHTARWNYDVTGGGPTEPMDKLAGKRVGIVGRSGAGKSTLVNLLLRFFDVQGGSVAIDGSGQILLSDHVAITSQRLDHLVRVGAVFRPDQEYSRPPRALEGLEDGVAAKVLDEGLG